MLVLSLKIHQAYEVFEDSVYFCYIVNIQSNRNIFLDLRILPVLLLPSVLQVLYWYLLTCSYCYFWSDVKYKNRCMMHRVTSLVCDTNCWSIVVTIICFLLPKTLYAFNLFCHFGSRNKLFCFVYRTSSHVMFGLLMFYPFLLLTRHCGNQDFDFFVHLLYKKHDHNYSDFWSLYALFLFTTSIL